MNANRIPPCGWLLTALALGLGTAGGFFAGRHWPGAADSPGRSTPSALTSNKSGPPGSPRGPGPEITVSPGAPVSLTLPHGASTAHTLRKILAIPESLERLATMKAWCRELPPEGVVEMMKEFKQMMEAQERIGEMEAVGLFLQSMEVVAQAMLEQGADGVLKTLLAPAAEGEEADLREGIGGEVFKKWAEQDLAAARTFLDGRLRDSPKTGEPEAEMSKNLMRSWVKSDPDAAMAWLSKQPEEISKAALSPAFQALSHHNPDKALQLVAAQADLPGRDEIAATIAGWWARTTPDKALGWAQGLPAKLAGPSVKEAITSWAGKDFAGARQAVEGLSAPLQQAALPVLVEHWEKEQWSDAAAYLDQQRGGVGRQEAVGKLIRQWADGDQQAASAWLARQTAGPERDAGASALAEEVRTSDPEAAAIWGATLGDERQRQHSLEETLQAWYKKSLTEALHWLETAPQLTDKDRSALMGSVPAK